MLNFAEYDDNALYESYLQYHCPRAVAFYLDDGIYMPKIARACARELVKRGFNLQALNRIKANRVAKFRIAALAMRRYGRDSEIFNRLFERAIAR